MHLVRLCLILLVVLLSLGEQLLAQQQPAETFAVEKTYDSRPFEYRQFLLAERALFRIERLTYPSPVTTSLPQNNTIPADLYLPKQLRSGVKYPAVICLHILDGNEPLTELVCSVLASRGIPAISFKLPYYGSRGGSKGPEAMASDPKMFLDAIRQAGEDIRRTVDLLASRPEINPERIGITGISLGGIIAASAAGADARLYRAGLLLSGGDVLAVVNHARETRPLSAMIRGLPPAERAAVESQMNASDPLRYASALRERAQAGRVLMLNAAQDEVIPRRCTEKLAEALGISDRVVWFPGVGHYTVVAELPKALQATADFFAQDLPGDARTTTPAEIPPAGRSPLGRLVEVAGQAIAMLTAEPDEGRCHSADVELSAAMMPTSFHVRFVRGSRGRFAIHGRLPEIGDLWAGQGRSPWLCVGGKTILVGSQRPVENGNLLAYVEPHHQLKLRVAKGVADSVRLAPEILEPWVMVNADPPTSGALTARIKSQPLWRLSVTFDQDGATPTRAALITELVGQSVVVATVTVHDWRTNAVASDALFEPPAGLPRQEVEQKDLLRVFAAAVNFALDRAEPAPPRPPVGRPSDRGAVPLATPSVIARDPAGHGLLCRSQGKTILMVSGTPAEIGAAHGALLAALARQMTERVLYLVGGRDTIHSGQWFLDRMVETERRAAPHIPPRFREECDALGRAAGISPRDARLANLFPEQVHGSVAALKGEATEGGRVLHACVIDDAHDIDLRDAAMLQLVMPEGRNRWLSIGYAGFVGVTTAMNDRGLCMGATGGYGDPVGGIPTSLLVRDVMERAANVDEALAILRAAPRACEHDYALSDGSGAVCAVHCTPRAVTVVGPSQRHAESPVAPENMAIVSSDGRAKSLNQRIAASNGRIDVPRLIDILKRPVATQANLHSEVFVPETLDVWFANATRFGPACDEPYLRVNLRELIEFYTRQKAEP